MRSPRSEKNDSPLGRGGPNLQLTVAVGGIVNPDDTIDSLPRVEERRSPGQRCDGVDGCPSQPSRCFRGKGILATADYDVPFRLRVPDPRGEAAARAGRDPREPNGRLQSVARAQNPAMTASSRPSETGIPMVLDPSFNENEPVVNTPGEALDCFLGTKMDLLVSGGPTGWRCQ
ncbi:MAG TPA: carbamoyltransferase C-terminal domain-containing protein [Thermoanaerobaculia bacterium]|nr:carbamoyltransferase C-terminal domain-containing protein [Thermoanaerobaculia bacterium]